VCFSFHGNGYISWRTTECKDVGEWWIVLWIKWTPDKSVYEADSCFVGSNKDCMTNCTDFRWSIKLWHKYVIFITKWICQDWDLDVSVAPVLQCQCPWIQLSSKNVMMKWPQFRILPSSCATVTYFEAEYLYRKLSTLFTILNVLKIVLNIICLVPKLIFQISNCVV
jgi:hypothetical protein